MVERYEVEVNVEQKADFFEAQAFLFVKGVLDVRGETQKCPSRDHASAVSYALAELSALIAHGKVKLP